MVPEWCEVGSLGLELHWHWILIGLAIDCYMIGMDRHKIGYGSAGIGMRLVMYWHKIDIRLTLDWYWIGNGLSLHWQWIGLACLLWAVNDGVLRHIGGSPIVLVPSGLCTMSVWNGSRLEWPLPIECRSMSDCPYGLAMEWHRIYIGLTMFVKSSSVETLRSGPHNWLVPRLLAQMSSDLPKLAWLLPMRCQWNANG